MIYTNLTGANLVQANLARTYLYGANLTDADLTRTDVDDANLDDNTNLENARWPLHASVPEGWTLDTISGLLKRINANPQTTEEK